MEVKKIVVTGGPRGGKTTIVNNIQNYFKDKDVSLITVPETASLMSVNGIPIQSRSEKIQKFQDLVYRMQSTKEQVAEESIAFLPQDKDIYIIYDRGVLDNRAYLSDECFSNLLSKYGGNELELASKYDYVIGLSSSSNIDGLYNAENGIRIEKSSEAAEIDVRTLDSWKLANNYRIISATNDFSEKLRLFQNTIDEIISGNFTKSSKRAIINVKINDEILNLCKKVRKSKYIIDVDSKNYKVIFEKCFYEGKTIYTMSLLEIQENNETLHSFKRITEEEFEKLLNSHEDARECSFDEYSFIKNNLIWKIISLDDGRNFIDVETTPQMLEPNIEELFSDATYINNYEYYELLKNREKQLKLTK